MTLMRGGSMKTESNMKYFIREILSPDIVAYSHKNAGGKAREDINAIFENAGFQPVDFRYFEEERQSKPLPARLYWHFSIFKKWGERLSCVKAGDTLFIQFPISEHSLFQASFFKKMVKRGVKVVLIVHDLSTLREKQRLDTSKMKKLRYTIEEVNMIKVCSKVIVHNDVMANYVEQELKIPKEKIVSLKIFDYLIVDWNEELAKKRGLSLDKPIVIAGNFLRYKAGYVYVLPDNYHYQLYGMNYDGEPKENINYGGAVMPEELPYKMSGSFGLVWDGERSDTCSGIYGNYLKINNPHKTSLYIASELPVIIWKEAALAPFVTENGLGIAVDSLEEIPEMISKLSEADYLQMQDSLKEFGKRLRTGQYTLDAVRDC